MALFNFGKSKAEKKAPACCCGAAPKAEEIHCGCDRNKIESIKVLGAGCKTCHQQYENAKEAIRKLEC